MGLLDRLFGKKSSPPETPPSSAGAAAPASARPTCPGNPGRGVSGSVRFSNAERSWTVLQMEFPAKDGVPARTRRALLGGVDAFAEKPAPEPEACGPDGEHPFCLCCLLTRNIEAFRPQLEGNGPFGIRFYAARSEDGTPMADCRVNGEDYEPGMESLRSYVGTWPGAGIEFRKQYVFIHTTATSEPSPRAGQA